MLKAIVNLDGWKFIQDAEAWDNAYPNIRGVDQPNSKPERYPCYVMECGWMYNPNGADLVFVAFLYDVDVINTELEETVTEKVITVGGIQYKVPRDQYNGILALAKGNSYVNAIREVRFLTKCGLKEAKDFIDFIR